jgi:hypothetical protein
VRFSTSNNGSSKTPQKKPYFLGKVHVIKKFSKKVEKNNFFRFSCRFFPSIFFIAFLTDPLHEELKNTIKILLKQKNRPENLKNLKKR